MKYSTALSILYACILTFCSNLSYSQCGVNCSVACNGQVNVSLGVGCQTEFTPMMGGKNVTAANIGCYTAEVFDHYNNAIPGALLTLNNRNQLLTYKITEVECNNYCWGTVLVEYKLGPQIVCPDDMTISCNALELLEIPIPDSLCAAVTMTMTSENYVNLSCDVDHQSKVIRTYKATDEFGNSTACSHDIYLKRLPLGEVIFPEKTVVSCSDPNIQYTSDGYPVPWFYQSMTDSLSQYGVPFLCQKDLVTDYNCPVTGIYGAGGTGSGTGSGLGYVYPGPSHLSGYYGLPLFPDEGGIVIIETGDTLAPYKTSLVSNPKTSHYCGAAVVYSDRELSSQKNPCVRKIFRTWEVIEWWCSEELNVTSLQIIEIVDDVKPAVTCPSPQTVNSTKDCYANIDIPSAYIEDQCNPDMDVRVEYGDKTLLGNGGAIALPPGATILTYIANDACGNSASCQVEYTVIDYTTPVAICEDEKIVSLASGDFTKVPAHVFDNGSYDDCSIDSMQVRRVDSDCHPDAKNWSDYAYFCCVDATVTEVLLEFRVVDASGNFGACQVNVVVQDKAIPVITCPPDMTIDCKVAYDIDNMGAVFGYGLVSDNCVSPEPNEVIEKSFDQCGIGLMIRNLQALGPDGSVLSYCTQNITISNENPFTIDDITWPQDYTVYDKCNADGLEPENLEDPFGFPSYNRNKCAQIGFDYEDELFSYNAHDGECAIISRTWIAINWCNGSGSDFESFMMPRPQIIKIQNTNAPKLDEGFDLEFETINDCENGRIDVTRTATDDCDDQLRWRYVITEFGSSDTLTIGNSNQIAGKFPVGSYLIYWSVYDKCGNSDSHIQAMQIVSKKAPTPVCYNGIAASLAGVDTDGDGSIDNELVTLWASDFDAGSYPACNGTLAFSLSSDLSDRNIIFDCDDIGIQTVEMWVTDVVTNAQDFCIATIEIQDAGICPDGARVVLSGDIYTEEQEEVQGVEVYLDGTPTMALTDETGNYAFDNMPSGGSYVVTPSLDNNYLNGVSTIDLILMQRHILGIESLDSPYKLIAADVNNSGHINGIDLVELRKLILGIYTELPANDSWRFVSSDYSFNDPLNPWFESWDDTYAIDNLSTDMHLDFVGVKIGDVNNTAESSLTSPLVKRNRGVLNFETNHGETRENQLGVISVLSDNYIDIRGWQGTFEYDPSEIEIVSIQAGGLKINEQDFYLGEQKEGLITMSYHNDLAETISDKESIFEFVFKAHRTISSNKELLSITSSRTKAEGYNSEFQSLDLRLDSSIELLSAKILSADPNPWINSADLKVSMPYVGHAKLEFYDVNGRLVYRLNQYLSEGITAIPITRQDLNCSGLTLVRLTVDGQSSEYRMMVY